uniref:Uncharacterized protein n=1 Tax=Compsopogon caeruleus TaxID=31354 RepID=A0A7S1TDI7_9RHOD
MESRGLRERVVKAEFLNETLERAMLSAELELRRQREHHSEKLGQAEKVNDELSAEVARVSSDCASLKAVVDSLKSDRKEILEDLEKSTLVSHAMCEELRVRSEAFQLVEFKLEATSHENSLLMAERKDLSQKILLLADIQENMLQKEQECKVLTREVQRLQKVEKDLTTRSETMCAEIEHLKGISQKRAVEISVLSDDVPASQRLREEESRKLMDEKAASEQKSLELGKELTSMSDMHLSDQEKITQLELRVGNLETLLKEKDHDIACKEKAIMELLEQHEAVSTYIRTREECAGQYDESAEDRNASQWTSLSITGTSGDLHHVSAAKDRSVIECAVPEKKSSQLGTTSTNLFPLPGHHCTSPLGEEASNVDECVTQDRAPCVLESERFLVFEESNSIAGVYHRHSVCETYEGCQLLDRKVEQTDDDGTLFIKSESCEESMPLFNTSNHLPADSVSKMVSSPNDESSELGSSIAVEGSLDRHELSSMHSSFPASELSERLERRVIGSPMRGTSTMREVGTEDSVSKSYPASRYGSLEMDIAEVDRHQLVLEQWSLMMVSPCSSVEDENEPVEFSPLHSPRSGGSMREGPPTSSYHLTSSPQPSWFRLSAEFEASLLAGNLVVNDRESEGEWLGVSSGRFSRSSECFDEESGVSPSPSVYFSPKSNWSCPLSPKLDCTSVMVATKSGSVIDSFQQQRVSQFDEFVFSTPTNFSGESFSPGDALRYVFSWVDALEFSADGNHFARAVVVRNGLILCLFVVLRILLWPIEFLVAGEFITVNEGESIAVVSPKHSSGNSDLDDVRSRLSTRFDSLLACRRIDKKRRSKRKRGKSGSPPTVVCNRQGRKRRHARKSERVKARKEARLVNEGRPASTFRRILELF